MKTIKKTKSSLASARQRLGLTQEQMAMQMGMSTSKVKLVETSRRYLSSQELVKLASLEIQLAAVAPLIKTVLQPSVKRQSDMLDGRKALELEYQEKRCLHEAAGLEKKLKAMIRQYEIVAASLNNLDAMEQLQLKPDELVVKNIPLLRARLLKKLARCNQQAQDMITKKIALLRAEASLIKSIQPRNVHTTEKPTFILSPLKQSNMNYTVSLITSRADCQAMIDMATEDKDSLDYRKTGLLRQKQNASTVSVSIDADLAAVTAEVSALQTVIDGLPDGDTKDDTIVRLKKAEYKKFLLEERKLNYGSLSLVSKELDIALVEQSIGETEAFIQALTVRMNELPAA